MTPPNPNVLKGLQVLGEIDVMMDVLAQLKIKPKAVRLSPRSAAAFLYVVDRTNTADTVLEMLGLPVTIDDELDGDPWRLEIGPLPKP